MTIGETLAAARREAGLTIMRVSEATRIRESIIEAIERDDFAPCGGHFYARGHIRAIANVVGVDSKPLIREYDEAHGGAPFEAPVRDVLDARPSTPYVERRRPNWSAAMALVLVIVVIYGMFRLISSAGGGASQEQVPRANQPPVVENTTPTPKPSPTSSPVSPEEKETLARAPKGVDVKVSIREDSWMSVRDSKDDLLYEGVLSAGTTRQWKDPKNITMVIGNAGGTILTVNGHRMRSLGDSGEVVHLTFNPNSPQAG